jgi:hypothetical protein
MCIYIYVYNKVMKCRDLTRGMNVSCVLGHERASSVIFQCILTIA